MRAEAVLHHAETGGKEGGRKGVDHRATLGQRIEHPTGGFDIGGRLHHRKAALRIARHIGWIVRGHQRAVKQRDLPVHDPRTFAPCGRHLWPVGIAHGLQPRATEHLGIKRQRLRALALEMDIRKCRHGCGLLLPQG